MGSNYRYLIYSNLIIVRKTQNKFFDNFAFTRNVISKWREKETNILALDSNGRGPYGP